METKKKTIVKFADTQYNKKSICKDSIKVKKRKILDLFIIRRPKFCSSEGKNIPQLRYSKLIYKPKKNKKALCLLFMAKKNVKIKWQTKIIRN
jgi:hypothetical protein